MAYDVFFLSYGEPNAETNWARLTNLAPHAKRVSGIAGILTAHQTCAKRAGTRWLFIIDADNLIAEFDFGFKVAPHETDYVHLWFAKNPVNDLEYGWGGIKLFPRAALLGRVALPIDMTTSFPLKVIPQTVSTSQFNTSAYAAWRSGFRESAKLNLATFRESDALTEQRLATWRSVGHERPFGEWAIIGANDGFAYSTAHGDRPEDLQRINDYEWLRNHFVARHGELA